MGEWREEKGLRMLGTEIGGKSVRTRSALPHLPVLLSGDFQNHL